MAISEFNTSLVYKVVYSKVSEDTSFMNMLPLEIAHFLHLSNSVERCVPACSTPVHPPVPPSITKCTPQPLKTFRRPWLALITTAQNIRTLCMLTR